MTALDTSWQAALAAEHEAVYGYGVLGPHLSLADEGAAQQTQRAHEVLRDATRAAMVAAQLTPVAPQADYPALYPVADAAAARRAAVELEQRCAAAWRYLFLQAASSSGALAEHLRTSAQSALTASAVRAARWRILTTPSAPTVPFPGL